MKILQIITNLAYGGAEKFVIELSNEQVVNNEVTLVSFKEISEKSFVQKIDKRVKFIQLFKKRGFSLKLYFQLYKLIKKEKPDIVHFHLNATLKYILPFTFFFFKKKFVYTIHANLLIHNNTFKYLNRYLYFKKNIEYVCISRTIIDEFQIKFKKIKFSIIENGLQSINTIKNSDFELEDVRKYKKNKNTIVFLSIGRIFKEKNYNLLIDSINCLKDKNIVCLIIGDKKSADKEYLEELEKKTTQNVYFIGKRDNVFDYLQNADAFLMTSLFEGMPIAALEAMSVGLPILTTPAGGMIDLVENNVNGFISKDFSVDNFKKCIDSFLFLNKQEKNTIKQNNQTLFQNNYTMQKCCENYLKLYTKNKC